MADLLQVLKGTSVRPRVTFYSSGVASDLDSGVPTVMVVRPDGTTHSTPTATKVAATTGVYEITLAPQAECTLLTVTWAGPIGGVTQTLTTYVEVLGNHLFIIPQLRALKIAGSPRFASTTDWPDAQLMDARAAVLEEFQQILGFPPVPRFQRVIVDGTGGWTIFPTGGVLKSPRLLSISINGTAQMIGNYQFTPASELESVLSYGYGAAITAGRRNVIIELVHGWERIMGDGSNVAMLKAAADLDPSGFSNGTTVTTPDGVSYTYEPSETGRGGFVRHTGIRAVDRWLNRWAEPVPAIA
jgi:hypothetical protein